MTKDLEDIINEIRMVDFALKKHGGRCLIDLSIYNEDTPYVAFSFWDVNKESALGIMRSLGIKKADKLYRMGDVDWRHNNITFNRVEKCKVIGYEEKIVPEHIEKIPKYQCPNGQKTVKVDD